VAVDAVSGNREAVEVVRKLETNSHDGSGQPTVHGAVQVSFAVIFYTSILPTVAV